jgi:hypothetical protein
MRIVDVLAVPVLAGFFFDDQLAIRAGAGHDGFDYTGLPLTPGFHRVRQPGEAVSVLPPPPPPRPPTSSRSSRPPCAAPTWPRASAPWRPGSTG